MRMKKLSGININDQIISEFLQGKTVNEIAIKTNLDITYITLVLYQEGIHYSNKIIFDDKINRSN